MMWCGGIFQDVKHSLQSMTLVSRPANHSCLFNVRVRHAQPRLFALQLLDFESASSPTRTAYSCLNYSPTSGHALASTSPCGHIIYHEHGAWKFASSAS